MCHYPLNCLFNLSYQLPVRAARKISGLEVLLEIRGDMTERASELVKAILAR